MEQNSGGGNSGGFVELNNIHQHFHLAKPSKNLLMWLSIYAHAHIALLNL